MTMVAERRYDGPAGYVPERDNDRLDSQLERVKTLMLDGRWRSLEEIATATGDPHDASISARLRDLRKPRFGEYVVDRRYVANGLYQYRVLTREQHLAETLASNPFTR